MQISRSVICLRSRVQVLKNVSAGEHFRSTHSSCIQRSTING
uniref:Uncharacterized protein n=1 Tax=Arundo donax TaxID=35708 RepID=A0A0A8ZWJ3_ARUDO